MRPFIFRIQVFILCFRLVPCLPTVSSDSSYTGNPVISPRIQPILNDSILGAPAAIPNSTILNPAIKSRFLSTRFCTASQKRIEYNAWVETGMLATLLSTTLTKQIPLYIHNPVFDLFIGTDVRNYGHILENAVGAAQIHDPLLWPLKQTLFVYCSEPPSFGQICTRYPDIVAYTVGDPGLYKDNHHIILCPGFFQLPTLDYVTSKIRSGSSQYDKSLSDTFKNTRAGFYFHETMHLYRLSATYQVGDSAFGIPGGPGIYGASDVAAGAAMYNVQGMSSVADAYAEAAASLYGQKTFALPKPPGPPLHGSSNGSYISSSQGTRTILDWNNSTRPSEVPNPNHPDNSPDVPGLTFDEPVPPPPEVESQ